MNASAGYRLVTRASQATKRKFSQFSAAAFGAAALIGLGAVMAPPAAQAAGTGITAVVIQKTGLAFGGCSIGNVGTYTYYQGYATDTIDPANALNTGITDIGLAPKDSNGYVDVYFNFQIIVPTNLANFSGRLVADWPNRSSATVGSYLNGSATATAASNCTGTYFYPQGYAVAQAGWEQDGAGDPTNGLSPNTPNTSFGVAGVNSYLATGTNVPKMPIATNGGNTITGPGYEYIVSTAGYYNLGGGIAYPNYPAASANANSLGGPCNAGVGPQANTVLTWRHHLDDTPFVLPNSYWQFNNAPLAGGAGNNNDGNCDFDLVDDRGCHRRLWHHMHRSRYRFGPLPRRGRLPRQRHLRTVIHRGAAYGEWHRARHKPRLVFVAEG